MISPNKSFQPNELNLNTIFDTLSTKIPPEQHQLVQHIKNQLSNENNNAICQDIHTKLLDYTDPLITRICQLVPHGAWTS